MKTVCSLISLSLLTAVAAGSAPATAQSLDAVTYSPLTGSTQFLSVNGSDGTATQTASLDPTLALDGLASYGGSLYTFDTATSSLLQLDAATGATLNSYSVGVSGIAPGGLAISSSGLVYLADPLVTSSQSAPASTIYAFNLTGGPAVTVGTTSDLLSGLAFNSDDTLYGLGKGDGELYTINTASGKGSLVGSLGNISVPDPLSPTGSDTYPIDSGPIGALAFSGSTLFAAADDTLYTVSTADGVATAVDPSLYNTGFGGGYYSVSGLAGAPAAVPEASSLVSFGALLGLGLLPLGITACRRKRALS